MKSKILLLILVTGSLLITQSCVVSERYIDGFGFMYAFTKSSIHGGESWNDPVGFQAGASMPVIKFNEPMSLKAGALVSLQGAKWEENNLKGKTSLWYLYIPVVARYQAKNGFFGEAGLQPGFLISAKDKYEGKSENFMDQMNKFDLSIPLVIGYEFKNNIGLNLRVIPGLNDITKDTDEADRNFVMGLGVTYTFRGK